MLRFSQVYACLWCELFGPTVLDSVGVSRSGFLFLFFAFQLEPGIASVIMCVHVDICVHALTWLEPSYPANDKRIIDLRAACPHFSEGLTVWCSTLLHSCVHARAKLGIQVSEYILARRPCVLKCAHAPTRLKAMKICSTAGPCKLERMQFACIHTGLHNLSSLSHT